MTSSVPVEEFDPFSGADNTVVGTVCDPYPALAEKRRTTPVEIERDDWGTRAVAYDHDSVSRILRDGETFSSTVYKEIMGILMGHTILEMDEPEHRLHRHLVSHAFRHKILEHWKDSLMGAVVHELIDAFVADGRADLVRRFTFPFPVQVISGILGLPREDYATFQRWSLDLISVAHNYDRATEASQRISVNVG